MFWWFGALVVWCFGGLVVWWLGFVVVVWFAAFPLRLQKKKESYRFLDGKIGIMLPANKVKDPTQ